jgi:hypothetical protein
MCSRKKNYDVVVNTTQDRGRRLAAFSARMRWNDALTGSTEDQMVMMVRIFNQMGLLEVFKGVVGDPVLPETMLVAAFGPDVPIPGPPHLAPLAAAAPPTAPGSPRQLLRQHTLREAGWASDEERGEAPFPIRHPERK